MAEVEKYEQPPVLEVSKAVEHKLTVFAALACIEDGDLTEERAVALYQITAEDLSTYRAEWESIN